MEMDKQINKISELLFSKLFDFFLPSKDAITKVTDKSYLKLSKSSKDKLNSPFTRDEIKRTAFDLGKIKAPGPNGFNARFYQTY